MGEITAVAVPSPEREAARDLVRAREDARADLMRARHRLGKFLLRNGIVYDAGAAWTLKHDAWLRRQRFDLPGQRTAFDACYSAVLHTTDRRTALDAAIAEMAGDCEFTPVVHRLGCLRGISTLTGFALAVEVGDWGRFTGRSIAAFMGLVPSEHSSGGSRAQGPITKTGNGYCRRLLVEAAWHHRTPYRPSELIRRRWALTSPAAQARGHEGNRRLHHRWQGFQQRHKRSTVASTAVAREMAGWCWSLAVLDD